MVTTSDSQSGDASSILAGVTIQSIIFQCLLRELKATVPRLKPCEEPQVETLRGSVSRESADEPLTLNTPQQARQGI